MVDAPRSEARLRHHEALALPAQQAAKRNPHVAQHQLAVALGGDVVHHRDVAHQLDTRRIEGHQDHALLVVRVGLRIGLAHHDQQPAVGVRGVGDEPLAPVDHVLVAVAADQRLDVGGIRGRHVRLGHGERRANLAFEQRLEPALALLWRGEQVQQLHVAGIRRVAVEHLGRPVHAPHDFRQRRVFEVAQARAGLIRLQGGQEQVPQPLRAGECLQVRHEGHRKVPLPHLLVPQADARHDVIVHEGAQLHAQRFHAWAIGKIHAVTSRNAMR